MMKMTGRKILWAILLLAIVAVVSVPQYLYFSGLRDVPDNRQPIATSVIPKSVTQSFWHYLEGEGAPSISPKNPYGLIVDILIEFSGIGSKPLSSAEYMLLSQAARSLMFRERFSGDWHLSNGSALIWISRNWTVDEAISTVLLDSYFGNGFRGIDSAARGYFGVLLSNITEIQMVYLLVIRAAPSSYDPWCNPENHRKRFELFSGRLGYSTDYSSIKSESVPEGMCE